MKGMKMIYLDDAIEAIASRDETDGTYNVFSGRQVVDILKGLPSAKSEKKTGKWIDKSGGIDDAWNYCSVCGEQAIDLYDYCPNCGADMRQRGEQE